MHASLLNEDLIQPKKLEMGISDRTGGRAGHFNWGWHEIDQMRAGKCMATCSFARSLDQNSCNPAVEAG